MRVTATRPHAPRLTATLREKESVTPLELFFDLVFVLALTQCTALMADEPTWEGLAKAMLDPRGAVVVVGRLRVADERRRPRGGRRADRDVRRDGGVPRRGAVRAGRVRRRRAAVRGRLRGRARGAHRAVRDRAAATTRTCARRSTSLAVSTAIGVGLLVGGVVRRRRCCRARSGRWRSCSTTAGRTSSASRAGSMMPSHFAERHGLIVIIALGESIVAIGVGVGRRRSTRASSSRAVLGMVVARGAVVAVLRRRRARRGAAACRRRRRGASATRSGATPTATCTCRWWPGSCCSRSGLKKTLGHVDEPLEARAGGRAARRHRDLPRSRTSRSGCATSTASACSGCCARSCWWR